MEGVLKVDGEKARVIKLNGKFTRTNGCIKGRKTIFWGELF